MPKTVFVASGTGKQGRSVARHLLREGYVVHSLVRNPLSEAAKELEDLGAVLRTGDLDSATTIEAALDNVYAVFLALPVNPTNTDSELTYAKTVIEVARSKGVTHFIYSGVARTGEHDSFPGWSDNYPLAWYWKNKAEIERMVREAGFQYWTILRPAAFMQNFCRPEVDYMFPELAKSHQLRVAYHPNTRLDLIDVSDIAKFVAEALEDPWEFDGKSIPLAGESFTAEEIAEQLGAIAGVKITVEYLDNAQANALKSEGHQSVTAQVWQRDVGYDVDIEALERFEIPLTPLRKALDQQTLGWQA